MNDEKIGGSPRETQPYLLWRKYRNGFYAKYGIGETISECRDFLNGNQYKSDGAKGMPKPVFNICLDYHKRCTAKVLETKYSVQFVPSEDSVSLRDMDDFYDFQMRLIGNRKSMRTLVSRGYRDGTGVLVTSFDRDTVGRAVGNKYKGYLKRYAVPFENTFWDNPYCQDPQDQSSWGYHMPIEVRAARAMLSKTDPEYDRKLKLIVPEEWDFSHDDGFDEDDVLSKTIRLYVRFFRVNGEVCFETATKYAYLDECPRSLNPEINSRISAELNSLRKALKKEDEESSYILSSIPDYEIDPARYALFEKAVKATDEAMGKERRKFWRYPVVAYSPDPSDQCILGNSPVGRLISNQKFINRLAQMNALILQYHAAPKWVVSEGALRGQVIDTSPNQVLTNYTPISKSRGNGGDIARISAGDAVSADLTQQLSTTISITRNLNGSDDLTSSSNAMTSGLAYQERVHQANLPLEEAQELYWEAVREQAQIDVMFFIHYIDDASFYTRKSDAEIGLNEDYRRMAQEATNAGAFEAPEGYQGSMPEVSAVRRANIGKNTFAEEYDVAIDVEQGIASSEASQAEIYQKYTALVMGQNSDVAKAKIMIENDPSIDKRTRQSLLASIESYYVDDLAVKQQENEKLKAMVEQMRQALKGAQANIEYANKVNESTKRAVREQAKENSYVASQALRQSQMAHTQIGQAGQSGIKSESQVKSDNARGISGGHFDITAASNG